jgi:hypothetical protein
MGHLLCQTQQSRITGASVTTGARVVFGGNWGIGDAALTAILLEGSQADYAVGTQAGESALIDTRSLGRATVGHERDPWIADDLNRHSRDGCIRNCGRDLTRQLNGCQGHRSPGKAIDEKIALADHISVCIGLQREGSWVKLAASRSLGKQSQTNRSGIDQNVINGLAG